MIIKIRTMTITVCILDLSNNNLWNSLYDSGCKVLFKMQVRIAPPSRTSYSGNYVCMQKCLLALLGFIPQLNKMAILIWHPHRLSVHLTVIKCNILNEFIVLELSTLNLSRVKEWNKIIITLICNFLIFRGKFIIYIYIYT